MHENIKYTVRLSEETKPYEPDRTVFPTPKDRKDSVADWQSIYAAIDHDTHYFIYAKYIGELDDSSGLFKVNIAQFYLQNYSGGVTIGIAKAEMDHTPYKDYTGLDESQLPDEEKDPDNDQLRYPKRKKFYTKFTLNSFNNKNFVEIKDPKVRDPKSGEHKPLIIKKGDLLQASSQFNPAPNHISRIFESHEEMQGALYVDEHYQEREGDWIGLSSQGVANLFDLGIQDQATSLANAMSTIGVSNQPKGRPHPCKPENSIFYP